MQNQHYWKEELKNGGLLHPQSIGGYVKSEVDHSHTRWEGHPGRPHPLTKTSSKARVIDSDWLMLPSMARFSYFKRKLAFCVTINYTMKLDRAF
jgi:hypothetical protein